MSKSMTNAQAIAALAAGKIDAAECERIVSANSAPTTFGQDGVRIQKTTGRIEINHGGAKWDGTAAQVVAVLSLEKDLRALFARFADVETVSETTTVRAKGGAKGETTDKTIYKRANLLVGYETKSRGALQAETFDAFVKSSK